MSNRLKKKRKISLPYWPSAEFIEAAVDDLKAKGMEAPYPVLVSLVKNAYWKKREEILANEPKI